MANNNEQLRLKENLGKGRDQAHAEAARLRREFLDPKNREALQRSREALAANSKAIEALRKKESEELKTEAAKEKKGQAERLAAEIKEKRDAAEKAMKEGEKLVHDAEGQHGECAKALELTKSQEQQAQGQEQAAKGVLAQAVSQEARALVSVQSNESRLAAAQTGLSRARANLGEAYSRLNGATEEQRPAIQAQIAHFSGFVSRLSAMVSAYSQQLSFARRRLAETQAIRHQREAEHGNKLAQLKLRQQDRLRAQNNERAAQLKLTEMKQAHAKLVAAFTPQEAASQKQEAVVKTEEQKLQEARQLLATADVMYQRGRMVAEQAEQAHRIATVGVESTSRRIEEREKIMTQYAHVAVAGDPERLNQLLQQAETTADAHTQQELSKHNPPLSLEEARQHMELQDMQNRAITLAFNRGPEGQMIGADKRRSFSTPFIVGKDAQGQPMYAVIDVNAPMTPEGKLPMRQVHVERDSTGAVKDIVMDASGSSLAVDPDQAHRAIFGSPEQQQARQRLEQALQPSNPLQAESRELALLRSALLDPMKTSPEQLEALLANKERMEQLQQTINAVRQTSHQEAGKGYDASNPVEQKIALEKQDDFMRLISKAESLGVDKEGFSALLGMDPDAYRAKMTERSNTIKTLEKMLNAEQDPLRRLDLLQRAQREKNLFAEQMQRMDRATNTIQQDLQQNDRTSWFARSYHGITGRDFAELNRSVYADDGEQGFIVNGVNEGRLAQQVAFSVLKVPMDFVQSGWDMAKDTWELPGQTEALHRAEEQLANAKQQPDLYALFKAEREAGRSQEALDANKALALGSLTVDALQLSGTSVLDATYGRFSGNRDQLALSLQDNKIVGLGAMVSKGLAEKGIMGLGGDALYAFSSNGFNATGLALGTAATMGTAPLFEGLKLSTEAALVGRNLEGTLQAIRNIGEGSLDAATLARRAKLVAKAERLMARHGEVMAARDLQKIQMIKLRQALGDSGRLRRGKAEIPRVTPVERSLLRRESELLARREDFAALQREMAGKKPLSERPLVRRVLETGSAMLARTTDALDTVMQKIPGYKPLRQAFTDHHEAQKLLFESLKSEDRDNLLQLGTSQERHADTTRLLRELAELPGEKGRSVDDALETWLRTNKEALADLAAYADQHPMEGVRRHADAFRMLSGDVDDIHLSRKEIRTLLTESDRSLRTYINGSLVPAVENTLQPLTAAEKLRTVKQDEARWKELPLGIQDARERELFGGMSAREVRNMETMTGTMQSIIGQGRMPSSDAIADALTVVEQQMKSPAVMRSLQNHALANDLQLLHDRLQAATLLTRGEEPLKVLQLLNDDAAVAALRNLANAPDLAMDKADSFIRSFMLDADGRMGSGVASEALANLTSNEGDEAVREIRGFMRRMMESGGKESPASLTTEQFLRNLPALDKDDVVAMRQLVRAANGGTFRFSDGEMMSARKLLHWIREEQKDLPELRTVTELERRSINAQMPVAPEGMAAAPGEDPLLQQVREQKLESYRDTYLNVRSEELADLQLDPPPMGVRYLGTGPDRYPSDIMKLVDGRSREPIMVLKGGDEFVFYRPEGGKVTAYFGDLNSLGVMDKFDAEKTTAFKKAFVRELHALLREPALDGEALALEVNARAKKLVLEIFGQESHDTILIQARRRKLLEAAFAMDAAGKGPTPEEMQTGLKAAESWLKDGGYWPKDQEIPVEMQKYVMLMHKAATDPATARTFENINVGGMTMARRTIDPTHTVDFEGQKVMDPHYLRTMVDTVSDDIHAAKTAGANFVDRTERPLLSIPDFDEQNLPTVDKHERRLYALLEQRASLDAEVELQRLHGNEQMSTFLQARELASQTESLVRLDPVAGVRAATVFDHDTTPAGMQEIFGPLLADHDVVRVDLDTQFTGTINHFMGYGVTDDQAFKIIGNLLSEHFDGRMPPVNLYRPKGGRFSIVTAVRGQEELNTLMEEAADVAEKARQQIRTILEGDYAPQLREGAYHATARRLNAEWPPASGLHDILDIQARQQEIGVPKLEAPVFLYTHPEAVARPRLGDGIRAFLKDIGPRQNDLVATAARANRQRGSLGLFATAEKDNPFAGLAKLRKEIATKESASAGETLRAAPVRPPMYKTLDPDVTDRFKTSDEMYRFFEAMTLQKMETPPPMPKGLEQKYTEILSSLTPAQKEELLLPGFTPDGFSTFLQSIKDLDAFERTMENGRVDIYSRLARAANLPRRQVREAVLKQLDFLRQERAFNWSNRVRDRLHFEKAWGSMMDMQQPTRNQENLAELTKAKFVEVLAADLLDQMYYAPTAEGRNVVFGSDACDQFGIDLYALRMLKDKPTYLAFDITTDMGRYQKKLDDMRKFVLNDEYNFRNFRTYLRESEANADKGMPGMRDRDNNPINPETVRFQRNIVFLDNDFWKPFRARVMSLITSGRYMPDGKNINRDLVEQAFQEVRRSLAAKPGKKDSPIVNCKSLTEYLRMIVETPDALATKS